jgi:hypothetical protein
MVNGSSVGCRLGVEVRQCVGLRRSFKLFDLSHHSLFNHFLKKLLRLCGLLRDRLLDSSTCALLNPLQREVLLISTRMNPMRRVGHMRWRGRWLGGEEPQGVVRDIVESIALRLSLTSEHLLRVVVDLSHLNQFGTIGRLFVKE